MHHAHLVRRVTLPANPRVRHAALEFREIRRVESDRLRTHDVRERAAIARPENRINAATVSGPRYPEATQREIDTEEIPPP